MIARGLYRVRVRSAGARPAFVAPRNRIDHVEVVNLETGEVELYWDLPAREARRLAGRLHEDLDLLAADDFLTAWRNA
jgi:hypothetical protein